MGHVSLVIVTGRSWGLIKTLIEHLACLLYTSYGLKCCLHISANKGVFLIFQKRTLRLHSSSLKYTGIQAMSQCQTHFRSLQVQASGHCIQTSDFTSQMLIPVSPVNPGLVGFWDWCPPKSCNQKDHSIRCAYAGAWLVTLRFLVWGPSCCCLLSWTLVFATLWLGLVCIHSVPPASCLLISSILHSPVLSGTCPSS
jgi:hypothetical protein